MGRLRPKAGALPASASWVGTLLPTIAGTAAQPAADSMRGSWLKAGPRGNGR